MTSYFVGRPVPATSKGDVGSRFLIEKMIEPSDLLKNRLDVDFGILNRLVGCRALTSAASSRIRSAASAIDRSEMLLDYVEREKKCEVFVQCLRDSGQPHLANYITSAGAYDPEFGDDWPLVDEIIYRIDVNQEFLVDMIDTCDLLGFLVSKGVLNNRHKEFVASKQTNYEKNEALLDIIRRTSLKKYKEFIECLNLSNQGHLADVLTGETVQVAVGIHCRIEQETSTDSLKTKTDDSDVTGNNDDVTSGGNDADDDEDEIIDQMERLLASKGEAKSRKILEKLQLRLFAVKKCNSICMYFLCEKSSQLSLLHNLLKSGGLKTAVETVFNHILLSQQRRRRSIRVSLSYKSTETYARCRKFLESQSSVRTGLSEKKLDLLKMNCDFLTKFLVAEEFLKNLSNEGIIDETQMNVLYSTPLRKRYESLIDILKTKTNVEYRKIIKCLRQNNEDDIAEVLQSGGAVARVEVEISGPDVQRSVSAVVGEITVRLRNKTSPGNAQLSELTRLKLIAAGEQGPSPAKILLYFHLSTLEDLQHLHELVDREELSTFVESVVNSLLSPPPEARRKVMRLRWNRDEYERIQCYMTEAEAIAKETRRTSQSQEISNTTMDELPVELLDSFLLKSFLIPFCCRGRRLKGEGGGEGESVVCLSSVNYFWFDRLNRRQFRRTLQRSLNEFFKRTMTKVNLLRNSWNHLLENIKVKSLVDRFRRAGSLSDQEIRLMKANGLTERRKNEALLHFIHSNAYITSGVSPPPSPPSPSPPPPSPPPLTALYRDLLRSLRETNQEPVANFLERGGVIVEAHVVHPNGKRLLRQRDESEKFTQKLNDVIEKCKRRCDSVQRQLEDDGIELIEVSVDREIVWRFSCREKNSLVRLRELFSSGQLRNVLDDVLRKTSPEIYHTISDFKLSVENEAFAKESVILRPSATLLKTLDTRGRCIAGVTCLQSKVYVLCHSPCVILVHGHVFPFPTLAEGIAKDEIKHPNDIASSRPSNCLYVSDGGSDGHDPAVWKVSPTDFDAVRWLSGIERPSTLAVNPDGRVLILRWGERPVMKVYSPEAMLLRTIVPPPTIEYPRHVVETRQGSWILCYWIRIDRSWSVCEILADDGTGSASKISRQFDLTDLKYPFDHTYHLSLDEYQRVFVADFRNNRVVLHDPYFRFSQVLLTERSDGIVAPCRIHYHLETRHLLVVHGGSGFREMRDAWGGRFVDVYEIS